ncbi:hypothetical protein [Rhizorhabdus argentea]|uniref:hypothetical protein n=1 Tax=Rhizorhabdus argentea TaxID=1387174 RepID=UPI0030EF689C
MPDNIASGGGHALQMVSSADGNAGLASVEEVAFLPDQALATRVQYDLEETAGGIIGMPEMQKTMEQARHLRQSPRNWPAQGPRLRMTKP